jgi:hypothetical protein
MGTEELAQVATLHHSAIARQELRINPIEATPDWVAQSQEVETQEIVCNAGAIAQHTGNILELYNQACDYLRGRFQIGN